MNDTTEVRFKQTVFRYCKENLVKLLEDIGVFFRLILFTYLTDDLFWQIFNFFSFFLFRLWIRRSFKHLWYFMGIMFLWKLACFHFFLGLKYLYSIFI